MKHFKIRLVCQFSGVTHYLQHSLQDVKEIKKLKNSVGQIFNQFDKKSQINYTWQVCEISEIA